MLEVSLVTVTMPTFRGAEAEVSGSGKVSAIVLARDSQPPIAGNPTTPECQITSGMVPNQRAKARMTVALDFSRPEV